MDLSRYPALSHISDGDVANRINEQFQRLETIIQHVIAELTQLDNPPANLTQDIGLSYRDRTRNFLPFTSVAALTRAYRKSRISKGMFELLNTEEEIAEYRQIRVSQVLTHYNREIRREPVQEGRVMTMALAEILSRTLFFQITTNPYYLDDITLVIHRWLMQFPACQKTDNIV